MSVCEVQQEAQNSVPLSRQCQQRGCLSCRTPRARPETRRYGERPYALYGKSHFLRRTKSHSRFANEGVSDEMLLKHVAEGDEAAMHIFFTRHRANVFRFISRMVRNPTIAEDVLSQVFLDVWRSANRFESRARVASWLLSMARFKAINALRERRHESIDQDHILAIADTIDTPEAALDRKETSDTLQACLD